MTVVIDFYEIDGDMVHSEHFGTVSRKKYGRLCVRYELESFGDFETSVKKRVYSKIADFKHTKRHQKRDMKAIEKHISKRCMSELPLTPDIQHYLTILENNNDL